VFLPFFVVFAACILLLFSLYPFCFFFFTALPFLFLFLSNHTTKHAARLAPSLSHTHP
jgi:hypothetical protein